MNEKAVKPFHQSLIFDRGSAVITPRESRKGKGKNGRGLPIVQHGTTRRLQKQQEFDRC